MAKAKRVKRKSLKRKLELSHENLLPLFIITICVVFSFVFTVMLVPMGNITADIRLIFTVMLIASTTVASTVALIIYLLLLKR